MLVSREDLGNFLYCSGLLEEKVARAYEHVSKLVDDRIIGGLLNYIAQDSLKHAGFFKSMAELLFTGLKMGPGDCERAWGSSWRKIVEGAEEILRKNEMGISDLSFLVKDLEKFEGFVAEEYLTIIHAKLIELVASEMGGYLDHFKMILEWIIEDEERHRRILQAVGELIAKKR
ncbi:MAG: hypothetical protein NZ918_02265 [Aigarchaeota archaeon]|nr:hypothetical protein [Aigarchaeota archaeon]